MKRKNYIYQNPDKKSSSDFAFQTSFFFFVCCFYLQAPCPKCVFKKWINLRYYLLEKINKRS